MRKNGLIYGRLITRGRAPVVADVIDRVPKLGYLAAYAKQTIREKLIEHKEYILKYGEDMPEIRDDKWPY